MKIGQAELLGAFLEAKATGRIAGIYYGLTCWPKAIVIPSSMLYGKLLPDALQAGLIRCLQPAVPIYFLHCCLASRPLLTQRFPLSLEALRGRKAEFVDAHG